MIQSGVEIVQDPELSKNDRPLWVAVEALDLAVFEFEHVTARGVHCEAVATAFPVISGNSHDLRVRQRLVPQRTRERETVAVLVKLPHVCRVELFGMCRIEIGTNVGEIEIGFVSLCDLR